MSCLDDDKGSGDAGDEGRVVVPETKGGWWCQGDEGWWRWDGGQAVVVVEAGVRPRWCLRWWAMVRGNGVKDS